MAFRFNVATVVRLELGLDVILTSLICVLLLVVLWFIGLVTLTRDWRFVEGKLKGVITLTCIYVGLLLVGAAEAPGIIENAVKATGLIVPKEVVAFWFWVGFSIAVVTLSAGFIVFLASGHILSVKAGLNGILGFRFLRKALLAVLAGAGLVGVALSFTALVNLVTPVETFELPYTPFMEKLFAGLEVNPLFSALALFGAGLGEEAAYRAFTYSFLRVKLGRLPALILSSTFFAISHYGYPIKPLFLKPAQMFIVGFILALLYEKTGYEFVATAHGTQNVIAILLSSLLRV